MTSTDSEAMELRAQIQQYLVESGNYERISNRLNQRLLDEGWIEKVKKITREVIGVSGATKFSEVLQEVEPEALKLVSTNTKDDIMQQIRAFLCEVVDT